MVAQTLLASCRRSVTSPKAPERGRPYRRKSHTVFSIDIIFYCIIIIALFYVVEINIKRMGESFCLRPVFGHIYFPLS